VNVLSLFDGMSCGRIALERAGIKVDKYFASEIDKYAIQVAKKNYPDTIHIGDVQEIMYPESFDGHKIDLVIGGSPCQGFSFAGKNLNFDDPRSKLFFEYARLVKECKPKYFLLENVRMKQESQDVISEILGVKPIAINSSLVSAQNRNRLYWTNIPVLSLPDDKRILLQDILEHNTDSKYQLSEKAIKYVTDKKRLEKKFTEINGQKSLSLMAQYDKSKNGTFLCVDANGRYSNEKTGAITSRYHKGVENYGSNPFIAEQKDSIVRKLTPIECERLQTVPDNYTEGVSNTQRYKMLGNGWTVDVIAHIFKEIKKEIESE
jgi:DNA-cytosine methyltransferase